MMFHSQSLTFFLVELACRLHCIGPVNYVTDVNVVGCISDDCCPNISYEIHYSTSEKERPLNDTKLTKSTDLHVVVH